MRACGACACAQNSHRHLWSPCHSWTLMSTHSPLFLSAPSAPSLRSLLSAGRDPNFNHSAFARRRVWPNGWLDIKHRVWAQRRLQHQLRFHNDLQSDGQLPRESVFGILRSARTWQVTKQQLQIGSWHGTDGVWFQCWPQLWATRARLFLRQVCFLNLQDPGNWSQDLCPQWMSRCWEVKGIETKVSGKRWDIEKISIKIFERKAKSWTRRENEAQGNYQKLKLMWKLEDGSREVQKSPFLKPIENLNLKGCSFIKRIHGPTMLKEKEYICVESWKWGVSSSKKVAQ